MLVTYQIKILFEKPVDLEDSREIASLLKRGINHQILNGGIHPGHTDNFARKIEIINEQEDVEETIENNKR